ncbi:MAG: hypothetical protein QM533_09950 [Cytophagales bacterium]|nr:hypothetical protein [Cytophagales bacterium]
MLLALIATGLLAGCPSVSGDYACGAAGTKTYSDCQASRNRELAEFHKKKDGEPISLKNALKDDDSVCYKNPQAGEKPCATGETKEK